MSRYLNKVVDLAVEIFNIIVYHIRVCIFEINIIGYFLVEDNGSGIFYPKDVFSYIKSDWH